MRGSFIISSMLVAAIAGFAPTCVLGADTKAPAGPGATRSASFENWALNCQQVGEAPKTHTLCEVLQSIVVEGQKEPLARIAIGRLAADQPWHLTVVLPTNIALPHPVRLDADGKTLLELGWTRCVPGACFAEADLKTDLLAQWRVATAPGKVTFVDANGQAVSFPMSFKGLGPAMDAMAAR